MIKLLSSTWGKMYSEFLNMHIQLSFLINYSYSDHLKECFSTVNLMAKRKKTQSRKKQLTERA